MSRNWLILCLIIIFSLLVICPFTANEAKFKSISNQKESEHMREPKYSFNEDDSKVEEKETLIQSKYKSDEFQAGMNVLVYGHPDRIVARNIFVQLCELGINSVAITFPFYQQGWQANEVSEDNEITPTMLELQALIEEAQAVGLSVMIRPILDEKNIMSENKWRGQIEPQDAHAWFQSYRSFLIPYAKLAQSMDVQVFNIGTEFNSLQNRYSDQWIELINAVRKVYKGELIYSFNWDTVHDIPANEFIEHLDHIGIDAYFPLNQPDGASADELLHEWHEIIEEFEDSLNDQSIIITEAGILPVAGAYRTPYAWSIRGGELDLQAQARYYEATYRAWKPMIQGLYWWTVTLDVTPEEIDYSPLRMSTESVIKSHYLKVEEDLP